MEESRFLKPSDIPSIITSHDSSPEFQLKTPDNSKSIKRKNNQRRKSGNRASATGSGSLKYEIGTRKSSVPNVNVPTKWSSVRIKGTGFIDSRKSVVKIESCNGIPNLVLSGKELSGLKSPNNVPNKNFGEVSSQVYLCDFRLNYTEIRPDNYFAN